MKWESLYHSVFWENTNADVRRNMIIQMLEKTSYNKNAVHGVITLFDGVTEEIFDGSYIVKLLGREKLQI